MSVILNDTKFIKTLKLYKTKFLYPIDLKNRFTNSIVYLLSPNIESSINIINNPLAILNTKLFKSYFLEKSIQLILNNNLNEMSILDEHAKLEPLDEKSNDFYSFENNTKIFYPDILENIFREQLMEESDIFGLSESFGNYNYSNLLKNILYSSRIKTQKECINIYNNIKDKSPSIKYAYTNPLLFKSKNIYYDYSYYISSFYENNSYTLDKGVDIFVDFISKFLSDKRFSEYTNKTVVIPIDEWIKFIQSKYGNQVSIISYKDTINPISVIYRILMRKDLEEFKIKLNVSFFVFLSNDGYFTLDLNNNDINRGKPEYAKFDNLIKLMYSKQYNTAEEIQQDSKDVIMINLANKFADGGINLDNLTKNISNISSKELKDKGYIDNPETTDNIDIKKAVLVDKLEKVADKSSTSKDAEENIDTVLSNEDKDKVKDLIIDIQSSDGPNMNAVRQSRFNKAKEEMYDKNVNGKTIKELLDSSKKDEPLPEVELPIDTINDEWKHMKFQSFNEVYDLDADITAMFSHFVNVTHPMTIINISKENTSTSEDYKSTWTVKYEDAETGKRFNIILDIPELIENRFMKLRGNEKILLGQLMLLPIEKTDEDTVQIVSNYNKIFVRRKSPGGLTKSSIIINKLVKALDKYKGVGKNIFITYGDNSKVCSKYELPMEFIDMANIFSKLTFKDGSYISFNMDELNKLPFDKSNVDKNLSDEVLSKKYFSIYVKNGKRVINKEPEFQGSVDSMILNIINSHIDDNNKFMELYDSIPVAKRLMYSQASILNISIPVIVLLGYSIGLQEAMNKAGVIYKLSNTRPTGGRTFIKFSNNYLEYECKNSSQSLLMNGMMECDTSDYNAEDMNGKDMWLNILDDFGGRIKADGMDNFYDLMMDPKTIEICKILKIPYKYPEVLIYANNLLSDNKYSKHTDITGNRLRINEIIAAHLYQIISKAYGDYRNMIKRNKGLASFSVKKTAVIDSILSRDQTSSDLSTLNPLLENTAATKVTFKGVSGMNSDRAYSIDKRTFDDSMLGVVGLSTGFASTVGINRQLTMNSNIKSKFGFISPVKPKDLNTTNTMCTMEAMSPMAINHDDPFRTAMAFTQSAQHQMMVKKSMPNLVTTGADEALPYITSNKFSYKFKGKKGKVLELTDDYIIIEDSDTKKKDFIDIRETIQKNSDGGFYIVTKLSPNVKKGDILKNMDIVAYDKSSYSNSIGKQKDNQSLAYNIGTLSKVAIMTTDLGYEDSCIVDDSVSNALETIVCVQKSIVIPKNANIYNMVNKGQPILEGDPLLIFQDSFDDADANALLKSISDENIDILTDLGRKQVRSKLSGFVQDIKIYRTCDIEELSPTLKKLVKKYESNINSLKKVMKDNDIDKTYTLASTDKLAQEGKLKNVDGVLIEFYLRVNDKFGLGDKLVFYQALKGVCSYIVPKGEEPYTDFRPKESINAFLTISGVMGRMVPSALLLGYTNKWLIELTRQCKEELGLPWKNLQDILKE